VLAGSVAAGGDPAAAGALESLVEVGGVVVVPEESVEPPPLAGAQVALAAAVVSGVVAQLSVAVGSVVPVEVLPVPDVSPVLVVPVPGSVAGGPVGSELVGSVEVGSLGVEAGSLLVVVPAVPGSVEVPEAVGSVVEVVPLDASLVVAGAVVPSSARAVCVSRTAGARAIASTTASRAPNRRPRRLSPSLSVTAVSSPNVPPSSPTSRRAVRQASPLVDTATSREYSSRRETKWAKNLASRRGEIGCTMWRS
jgi:hypothetical protein